MDAGNERSFRSGDLQFVEIKRDSKCGSIAHKYQVTAVDIFGDGGIIDDYMSLSRSKGEDFNVAVVEVTNSD